MAEWQLGHKEAALKWRTQALDWMEANPCSDVDLVTFNSKPVNWIEKHRPTKSELVTLRAEAEQLLGRMKEQIPQNDLGQQNAATESPN
jgi:hypothetical protein